ncbi:MAG: hypothetical protein KKB22_02190, partial [Candidatus Omnitrophica bacterium]|nr:hypothetical protein [Candidatus Omnitrophota bacterium]
MLIKIISNTLIIFALILVITLWLRNINKKRLIVTVIILLFLSILNSLKINIFTFEKSAKELISKTDTIAEKSRSFNSQRALKNLPANKMNGFYYRFSDHLDEADFENNKHAIATYLALNKEMRKVISAPVPSIIKYSLILPEKQLFLKFGFGALDNNPVKFTAHIRSKGMEKNIFS